MPIITLDTRPAVAQFVRTLRDPKRARPTVLLSTKHGETETLIDVQALHRAVVELADVYVIRTGALTYYLGDLMVDGTHVFGGAGRVYPPGVEWEADTRKSPLRFVWDDSDAPRALAALTKDVAAMSAGTTSAAKPAPLTNTLGDLAELRQFAETIAAVPPPAAASPAVEGAAKVASASKHTSSPTPASAPSPGPAGIAAVIRASASSPAAPTSAPEPETATERRTALRDTQLALEAAKAEVAKLTAMLVTADRDARNGVRGEMVELQQELNAAERALEDCRARNSEQVAELRKKARSAATVDVPAPYRPDLFLSAEDAVRHAVLLAWAERVSAADKASFPLPTYGVGDRFAASLADMDAAKQTKALRCVVDVLTDRARDLTSRQVHVLRSGPGGDDAPRTREDGAVCFRAYIEANSASARRLHFWKLTDGSIELSRVVLHDDLDA